MSPSSVAIIVRTKDRPVFLKRALEDIARQTYRDYEVVVVNDAGAQAQVNQIVESARDSLNTVQVLHRERSTGMEAATNAGIAASNSTFISVHDDDDLWEPEFLERMVGKLESTGAAMAVARTDQYFERVTEDGFEFIESRPFWEHLSWMNPQDFFRINRAVPIGILYRRELHVELGLFNEALPVVGDWEFNMRVAARHEIAFVDENLAHWSQRPESTGVDGNSMIEGKSLHSFYDSSVRAEAIRADIAGGASTGPYLYQAHLANEVQDAVYQTSAETHRLLHELSERIVQLENKLAEVERSQQQTRTLVDRVLNKATSMRFKLQPVADRLSGRKEQ